MNILITAAGSELARNLAERLAEKHTLRLTELHPIENTVGTFVQSELGHDETTDELVRDIDTIIHIAEVPSQCLSEAGQPDNYAIDYQTRCTYNLLMAASAEGVKHVIYASTLRLFEQHGEDWTVTESWRPQPAVDSFVLSKHLGEFTCREFGRERKLNVTCLRLGNLVTAETAATADFDAMWLEMNDAVAAFECALNSSAAWQIFHIQSEFPGSRFSVGKAKSHLEFNPQFVPSQS
ncbi:NAD(P)-dependent oxidoreductase [Candidatus Poribacteria bacterium]|nr:NAD(P)-dependent oxidoreductase [Candidatus Poribacteria bacterium]MXY26929.1 NAD(P)-dependent oxidoreductase [Candidatus Poribacteria bacterium]MYK18486.1 NAD(P)-dependent oxidoreductase [Candidatus Poribacteria bacterium]